MIKKSTSKSKGSEFERIIAKRLTLWISGQSKEYWFWRTPSSGAMGTLGNSVVASGDIISIKQEGEWFLNRYSIEVKNGYPNSSFHKHLKGVKNDEIRIFWEQCVRDATRADKLPLLIYKKKHYNALIGVSDFDEVINLKLRNIPSITMKWCDNDTLPICHFFDIEEYLNNVTPEDMKNVSL